MRLSAQAWHALDAILYNLYSFHGASMTTRKPLGVEEARRQLPHIIEQAAAGTATIITRHGKAVAALVPLDTYGAAGRQRSILPLVGTGRGLWGKTSSATIRKLRDEWSR